MVERESAFSGQAISRSKVGNGRSYFACNWDILRCARRCVLLNLNRNRRYVHKYEGSMDVKLQHWSLEFNPLFASIAMYLVDLAGLSEIALNR